MKIQWHQEIKVLSIKEMVCKQNVFIFFKVLIKGNISQSTNAIIGNNTKWYVILLTIEVSESNNFSDIWKLLETQQIICLLNNSLFLKHRNQWLFSLNFIWNLLLLLNSF
jgi:hypothetical protein